MNRGQETVGTEVVGSVRRVLSKEAPMGYKRTEVGVIPEDWEVVLIGDLFAFKNGLNKAKQFFGTGTPIVNYMDVFETQSLKMDDLSGRVNLSPREIKNFEVRLGDVFFTRTSETVEEIGVASVMLDESRDTVFSGFVLRARPLDDRLDDHYKQYCFGFRAIRSQIVSNATYTTRALTNGRSLSTVWIAVPPKPEQRAIAEALADVDELLGALDALIAKKRAIKQAAMQQFLTGKTRLPRFTGEWKRVRLGDVATAQQGGTPPTSRAEYWDGDIPFVTGADLSEFSVSRNNARSFLTVEGLNSGATAICEPGALLLATRTRVGLVSMASETMGASQDITLLKPKDLIEPPYLCRALMSQADMLLRSARGTTIQGVSRGEVDSLPILLPPRPEQFAITAILSDMDTEIARLKSRRNKTRDIKQGMMQQLLTGQVRLVEPHIVAEASSC